MLFLALTSIIASVFLCDQSHAAGVTTRSDGISGERMTKNQGITVLPQNKSPTILDGTPRDLIFYGGDNNFLYAECEAGLHWLFWRDGSAEYKMLTTEGSDLTVEINAMGEGEGSKRRSYLEWRKISESGEFTCCKLNQDLSVSECLRELYIEYRINGKRSLSSIIPTPAAEEVKFNVDKGARGDPDVAGAGIANPISEGRMLPTGTLVILIIGVIVLTVLVVGFGIYLHKSVAPKADHYQSVAVQETRHAAAGHKTGSSVTDRSH